MRAECQSDEKSNAANVHEMTIAGPGVHTSKEYTYMASLPPVGLSVPAQISYETALMPTLTGRTRETAMPNSESLKVSDSQGALTILYISDTLGCKRMSR